MFRDWEELQEPPRKRMTIFALTANVSGKFHTNHSVEIAIPLMIECPHTKGVSLMVKHQIQIYFIRNSLLRGFGMVGLHGPEAASRSAKFFSMNENIPLSTNLQWIIFLTLSHFMRLQL